MSAQAVVDSHHHVWDTNGTDYPWMVGELAALEGVHDMAELAPLLDTHNVVSTVLVQARADIDESLSLLALASANEEVAGVVGWVDLTSLHVAEQIAGLKTARGGDYLVGIRHGVADEADEDWLRREDVLRGLQIVSDAGLAFDLEVTERELAAAMSVADLLPDLRLVVDHLAKPNLRDGIEKRWVDGIAAIARRPNVSAKVSGLITEANWKQWTIGELQPAVDIALDHFGASRLMFGSDWPVCELAGSYGAVLAAITETIAGLSPHEQAQILSGSARAFYALC